MKIDEDAPKKPTIHQIGQELGSLSVHELRERIAQLQVEIARLEQAVVAKSSARSAADAIFKL
ncbi:MAG: DUF1192 domain-containing protein [Beijerinckiaceae bacterium]